MSPIVVLFFEAFSVKCLFNYSEMPPEDLSSWPGKPSELQFDVNGTLLKLYWKTPDDG